MVSLKSSSQKDDENPFQKGRNIKEKLIRSVLFIFASLAVIVSALIIFTLLEGSFNFFLGPEGSMLEFFFGTNWMPSGGDPSFGVLPLLMATLVVGGGATLIATPIGLAASIYLAEFAGDKVRNIVKPLIEMLAGIPSIALAYFALFTISPLFRVHFGASYFNMASAMIVISIMVIPIIVSISDDAITAVSSELEDGSLALGTTRWETTKNVIVPSASSGIIGSVLLGLARAVGETMVATLVAGSVANLTFSPLEEGQTMTAYMAQVAKGDIPPGAAIQAAFAVGLLLFIITYLIRLGGELITEHFTGGKEKKSHPFVRRAKERLERGWWRVKSILSTERDKVAALKNRYRKQKMGKVITFLCMIGPLLFLSYFIFNILRKGLPGMSITFLTSYPSRFPDKAGIFPVIMGSIYLISLTMVIAVPIGVGAAIYLKEFAPDKFYSRFLRRIIHNLAGVPSIVFGFIGYIILVEMFSVGGNLLSGSIILAFMALPIIEVSTEEALESVPDSFRDAARGLGATKWETVKNNVLPNALPGIMTGSILSLSRALGETAPILFITTMFAKNPPGGIFDQFMAMPTMIFYWTTHMKEEFQVLAATTIIVLLAILLTMNGIAIYIRYRTQKRRRW
ncbi:MAG: phosphate ABC transporter permease subunit PstC [Candidatus Thermoplasmatota archaeon]|nr:phosphate ABC transporter permease subunit PstC [Candidatus Thermoplasmatota archaeon]